MRILLVDDDHELSIMLQEFLKGEGIETMIAATGHEAINLLESFSYNAILLDIMLPDISGIELLRQIRKNNKIPILMLTAKGDNIDRVIGLELGADDYIPKPCFPRELIARLRAVLRRYDDREGFDSETRDLFLHGLKLSPTRRSVEYKNSSIELTASEFNLLEVLIRNFESVVSKDELSEKGIGRKRQIYDRSVDVHISNLRQKLQAATEENITVETVRGVGYTLKFHRTKLAQ
ncbi:response regulator transcription factor [Thorsellia anophelis]|uniref:DNA-binding response regulator, OmpR family, contains REC and winged-helix (WHTH) domain n=1 Tax=Thorsellia anophelis DSM 18579 TaxID=1123402 RepID=A0A1I0F151_9GAMM|nr:response regulator transcription factor [Thorsellia anophelis]SET51713.1 DNA-binding response regulator, OmpR family, contains REC and winged-helix (wHTH) domain [Thorsellia anophelis DSM 18579]